MILSHSLYFPKLISPKMNAGRKKKRNKLRKTKDLYGKYTARSIRHKTLKK